MKENSEEGFGIRPIHTTCNCGKPVKMEHNGSWHTANCPCGRNLRILRGKLIIELNKRKV